MKPKFILLGATAVCLASCVQPGDAERKKSVSIGRFGVRHQAPQISPAVAETTVSAAPTSQPSAAVTEKPSPAFSQGAPAPEATQAEEPAKERRWWDAPPPKPKKKSRLAQTAPAPEAPAVAASAETQAEPAKKRRWWDAPEPKQQKEAAQAAAPAPEAPPAVAASAEPQAEPAKKRRWWDAPEPKQKKVAAQAAPAPATQEQAAQTVSKAEKQSVSIGRFGVRFKRTEEKVEPAVAVQEAPPEPQKKPARSTQARTRDSDTTSAPQRTPSLPSGPKEKGDGIRLPNMLGLPEDRDLKATNPATSTSKSEGSDVISRPPVEKKE